MAAANPSIDSHLSAQTTQATQATALIGVETSRHPIQAGGYVQVDDGAISQFHQSTHRNLVMVPVVPIAPLYLYSFSPSISVLPVENQCTLPPIPRCRQSSYYSSELAKIDKVKGMTKQIQKDTENYERIIKEKEIANASNIASLQMKEEAASRKLTRSRRNLAKYKASLLT